MVYLKVLEISATIGSAITSYINSKRKAGVMKTGISDAQKACAELAASVEKASTAFKESCQGIPPVIQNPKEVLVTHELGRNTTIVASVTVTVGTAALGFYGVKQWKESNRLNREGQILGQLRENGCGYPSDLQSFKREVDQALIRHTDLFNSHAMFYEQCFKIPRPSEIKV